MADWVPLSSFPGIKPSTPPPPPKLVLKPAIAKATLEHAWLGYTISLGILTFFYYLTQFIEVSSTPIGFTCDLVLLASVVGTIVSFSMLLYKSWHRVSSDGAHLSPQRAVGLMFIPLFNLYWQFRAVYGLATFIAQLAENQSISTKPKPVLLLASCVLTCWLIIPGFEFLIYLPLVIVSSLGWKSIVDTLDAMRPEKPDTR